VCPFWRFQQSGKNLFTSSSDGVTEFFFFFLATLSFLYSYPIFKKGEKGWRGVTEIKILPLFFVCLFVFGFETGFHSNGWPEPLGWSDPPATASQVAGIYVCATVPGFVLFLNTPQLLFKSTLHSYQRLSLSLWLVLQIDGT
jgi:hypothetical protein